MKLVWAEPGFNSLTAIKDYIRSEQPAAAEWIGNEIERTAELLAIFPGMGRKVPRRDARYFPVPRTSYILIYRVHQDYVSVLQVIHAATNWRR